MPEMPDFDEIMKMAQNAQNELQKAQDNLDKIEVETTSHPKRLRDRLDPELASVGTDQTDFTSPDAVVDTVLVALRRCYD